MECKCNKECGCCKKNWIRSAIWAIAIVIIVFLNSCEKEEQVICSIVFTPEQVIAHGHEITIYHKELVCEDY